MQDMKIRVADSFRVNEILDVKSVECFSFSDHPEFVVDSDMNNYY